ncbi:PEP/pyruvate-binding domain-containing protein [Actinoallomurus iriomotensis]|uniref:Phosphoenolpyruvate synthase n=1 Tax=Actinoallomurus iriomotensis TaxID=478107 RepID=A0A9W6RNP2_9ACTN|nr:PEP/pyruvate-binding domain-containing protein [Actinoallomurus iriomotensis]GLY79631.1 hypothetical protein Airi01_078980 [Actinoallomurus iriomotensis]
MAAFGTKAETLERLFPVIKEAEVLPLHYFRVDSWLEHEEEVLDAIQDRPWGRGALIVRSSTLMEDHAETLMPGRYLSVPDTVGREALRTAIRAVVDSYRADLTELTGLGDQHVLVQPMVDSPTMSGVVFTCDPGTGAPYVVVNYDEAGDTEAVTGGRASGLKTFYLWRHASAMPEDARLRRVVALARELEGELGTSCLDIEFAFDAADRLFLLQVRPLVVDALPGTAGQETALAAITAKVEAAGRPHPYLLGDRALFGVMPDWNPAEIIGTKPRPLALSIYRRLITDAQWAEQRVRYGYRDVRGFPLLLDFYGLPYVDIRASCNSLIPADLDESLAERLATYYLDRLAENPEFHDKLEFDVVFSSYCFDLEDRLKCRTHGLFDDDERRRIAGSLRALTNRLMRPEHPARIEDQANIRSLRGRLARIRDSELDPAARVHWLLEDCRRYGTLAFAGFARLGFIAVEMLRSLVAREVLDEDGVARLMASLDTVTNRMLRDRTVLAKEEFLATYGFLRPGTYDICSPRYDEAPDDYFDWSAAPGRTAEPEEFRLPPGALRRVDRLSRTHGLEPDAESLWAFITGSIVQRENSKFEFTRHLSEALSLIKEFGGRHGLDADDMSYVDVSVIEALYRGADEPGRALRRAVDDGRARHELTRSIVMPPVISEPSEVTAFHLPRYEPNYVTQRKVTAPVEVAEAEPAHLTGKILLLPSGDPGYDWIFSQGISGFVTRFGGANSHMAIRAHQLGIPAVIGAGETLYGRCAAARALTIDCLNHQVKVLP